MSKKLVLNKYKICLKMLEIAILETQIFKNFGETMPLDPSCAPRFESPGPATESDRYKIKNLLVLNTPKQWDASVHVNFHCLCVSVLTVCSWHFLGLGFQFYALFYFILLSPGLFPFIVR